MKKLAAILLILALCFAFAACGSPKEDTPPVTEPQDNASNASDIDALENEQGFDWNTLSGTYTTAYTGMSDLDEPVVYLVSADGAQGVFAMLNTNKGEAVRYVGAHSSDGSTATITDQTSGESVQLSLRDNADGTWELDSTLVTVTVTACDPADAFGVLNTLGVTA